MDIPFSNYKGGLKQLNTDFKFPFMRDVFDTIFSKFNDLHDMYEKLKKEGINTIVTAAGTEFNFGKRNRRFAGGGDLPSNRYFTICSEDDFNDFGTLRDEMYAYYSGASGIIPEIFDPKVDTWLTDYLLSEKFFTEEDARYPYYFCTCLLETETDRNKKLLHDYKDLLTTTKSAITYGIRQISADIDKIIDLRLPDTQDWFFKTFVNLELENTEAAAKKSGIHYLGKGTVNGFEELLPSIMSLEIGGGDIFGQAVGAWLRSNGANGLIFPSARSTCENKVHNGTVTDYKGWILVLYKDAPPPEEKNLFGNKATWKDRDHDHIKVKHIASGEERGSISIRGAKEWSLLNFDLEKQIAKGKQIPQAARMIGSVNFEITQAVNYILDNQAKENQLWFHDTDTVDFIRWCEEIGRS